MLRTGGRRASHRHAHSFRRFRPPRPARRRCRRHIAAGFFGLGDIGVGFFGEPGAGPVFGEGPTHSRIDRASRWTRGRGPSRRDLRARPAAVSHPSLRSDRFSRIFRVAEKIQSYSGALYYKRMFDEPHVLLDNSSLAHSVNLRNTSRVCIALSAGEKRQRVAPRGGPAYFFRGVDQSLDRDF